MIRRLVFWYWIGIVAARVVFGRWFVWKDAPRWVVEKFADHGAPPTGPDTEDVQLYDMWKQAKEEIRLRNQQARMRGLTT